jgi:hypothetical protein
MNYIFVNRTQLIPQVITFNKNELCLALQLLKKEGADKNVYIVKTYKTLNLSIIFYKNNSFQRINNNIDINHVNHDITHFNHDINHFNHDMDFIQQFEKDKISLLDSDMVHLNEPPYFSNSVLIDELNSNDAKVDANNAKIQANDARNVGGLMEVEVNGDKIQVNDAGKVGGLGMVEAVVVNEGHAEEGIVVNEEGEEEEGIVIDVGSNDMGDIIKKKLKDECEKVMELYTIQKDKVNKLSRDVLMMEKREKKLIQDIYDKKFNLLSNLHTDLMVYEQLREQDIKDMPILFCKKYEYFKNAKEDVYERIKSIDINKLLDEGINEETVNKYNLNELFTISTKYSNDLKKLNVIFEHSWSELEDDLGD